MSLTNATETELITHLLTTLAPSHIALFTTPTDDTGGGTEVSTSGTGYVRAPVTFVQAQNTLSNSVSVTFPTATGAWGTVTHFAFYDADTAGNMIAHGALTTPKIIGTGDVFNVPAEQAVISID